MSIGSVPTSGFVAVRVESAASPPSVSLSITLANGARIENIDLASVPLQGADDVPQQRVEPHGGLAERSRRAGNR